MGKQAICIKCMKEQPYKEKSVLVSFSINNSEPVLIKGIDRVCGVCGFSVDTRGVVEENTRRYESKQYVAAGTELELNDIDQITSENDKSSAVEETAGFREEESGQLSLF